MLALGQRGGYEPEEPDALEDALSWCCSGEGDIGA